MFGFLNLDKPAGMTSRDAVNHVQRLVYPEKLGHAGTLDPLATGVLVVCLGQATRLVPYLHEFSKTYVADFLLGVTSPTDDTEVDVTPLADAPLPTAEQIRAALPQFTGRISQVPPAHSAVKVQGRRAYDLARRGAEVTLEPREVQIHRLELMEFSPDQMTLEIECSSGTYIRSLGRDLGLAVGSAAVMCGLRRTRIGPFGVDAAINPSYLTRQTLPEAVLPPITALPHLPRVSVTEAEVDVVRRGMGLQRPAAESLAGEVALCGPTGELLALGAGSATGRIAPRMVFIR
jgi:tRNA pseudouridine55 synthase